jgi:hypothetical protein
MLAKLPQPGQGLSSHEVEAKRTTSYDEQADTHLQRAAGQPDPNNEVRVVAFAVEKHSVPPDLQGSGGFLLVKGDTQLGQRI